MNKIIWYGAKDNDVRFATSKSILNDEGFNNPRSFTVSGDVQGLNLIDEEQPQSQSQSGGPQAHT